MKKKWIPLLVILALGTTGLAYSLLSERGTEVPDLFASSGSDTALAIRGTYSWRSRGRAVHADSDHPVNFTYEEEHILEAYPGEKVLLTPMAGGKPVGPGFSLDSLEVYDAEGGPEGGREADAQMNGDAVEMKAPAQPGSYTAVLVVTFERGTVSYGVGIRTIPSVPMKGLELYLWKDHAEGGEVRFTLLPGTNRNKTEAEVWDPVHSEDQVEDVRKKLAAYPEDTEVFICRAPADDFTEAEFRSVFDALTKGLPLTFHDVGDWRR